MTISTISTDHNVIDISLFGNIHYTRYPFSHKAPYTPIHVVSLPTLLRRWECMYAHYTQCDSPVMQALADLVGREPYTKHLELMQIHGVLTGHTMFLEYIAAFIPDHVVRELNGFVHTLLCDVRQHLSPMCFYIDDWSLPELCRLDTAPHVFLLGQDQKDGHLHEYCKVMGVNFALVNSHFEPTKTIHFVSSAQAKFIT